MIKERFFKNRRFETDYSYEEFGNRIFGNGIDCLNKLKELDIEWKDEKNYYGFEKYKNKYIK